MVQNLQNYDSLRNNRYGRLGEGVALFIKKDLKYDIIIQIITLLILLMCAWVFILKTYFPVICKEVLSISYGLVYQIWSDSSWKVLFAMI